MLHNGLCRDRLYHSEWMAVHHKSTDSGKTSNPTIQWITIVNMRLLATTVCLAVKWGTYEQLSISIHNGVNLLSGINFTGDTSLKREFSLTKA